ncbi:MAG: hypothetical protein Q7T07_02745 [Burkholderiaceae bacterium]|nr:hypothetical protein [Burkholderiaceae bacterium]
MHLVKTDVGQKVFKDRSVQLSPRQRSAFIIFDGKRTIDDVLTATAGLGLTKADIDQMIELGLLAQLSEVAEPFIEVDTARPPGGMVELGEAQSRYAQAYPLATQLTASMGLRGFRLNLAVEAVGSYSQLVALFPKIRDAVGVEKSMALERALQG